MSQFPSPYLPPQSAEFYQPFPPPDELLRPARRAGLLLLVIGGVALFFACLCFLVLAAPLDHISLEQRQKINEHLAEIGLTFRQFFITLGTRFAVGGLVFCVMGAFVRRGGRKSIIVALVLISLLLLLMVLSFSQNGGTIGDIIAFAFLILQLVLLINAAKASRNSNAMSAQYQAQYWQYMQQQQMQQQGMGYVSGYTSAPPPPPPPASNALPSQDQPPQV